MAWVDWEYKLIPVDGKPLGSDTLRADTFIRGLATFKDGLTVSVKGQNTTGTTDDKLPKFLHYEVEHYPGAVILWLAGDHWKTEHGQEYHKVAMEMHRKMPAKLIAVISDTDELIRYLRDLASQEVEARKKSDSHYVIARQPKLL